MSTSAGPSDNRPENSPDTQSLSAGPGQAAVSERIIVQVEAVPARRSTWSHPVIIGLLVVSLLINVWYILLQPGPYRPSRIPEVHLLGDKGAADRIAVIPMSGTITPPFTERWIRQIKQAAEDESVRGAILVIDSPGGLVADSHQIYREVQKLVQKKPVFAAMKRIAASGGLYVAMGIGPDGQIFAEPTTWTGSIGVIIPRFNATELASKIGVAADPLVTGPLKDSLNPFRDLTDREQEVWATIMEDSFGRFVGVIADNRSQLDEAGVRQLATGQIYTANQALNNHLVDQIGYVEDAVEKLADQLQLSTYDAFEYRATPGLVDLLLGASSDVQPTITEQLLDATVPKAMYYCSWNPWIGGSGTMDR